MWRTGTVVVTRPVITFDASRSRQRKNSCGASSELPKEATCGPGLSIGALPRSEAKVEHVTRQSKRVLFATSPLGWLRGSQALSTCCRRPLPASARELLEECVVAIRSTRTSRSNAILWEAARKRAGRPLLCSIVHRI